MLRKEQIEYALHYADDPVEWVFELVRGLEKRIDELVKYGTKVTVFQEHWHPVSELPPEEGEYIVKREWAPARADLSYSKFENGKWSTPQVKWWCYPPRKEE